MSRGVWGRLIALVVILVGGFSYIAFSVLQFRAGPQPFRVSVELPRTGGLFDGSFVAYRGVDVGRVASVRLTATGVSATLSLEPGTRVPQNTKAVVHYLSAVGEQYLDLVPQSDGGPYLHQGSVISESSTAVPLQISTVMNDAGAFADSVNTLHLNQLLQSVSTALEGTGPELHNLLLAGETLSQDLGQVQPQTDTVIDQGRTLLDTAASTNPDVAQFSANLDRLTAQLKASNADIQALIANGAGALPQLNQLLAANTQALQQLTTAGAIVTQVTASNNAAVQALLASLPGTLGNLSSIVRNGAIQATFFYNDMEPVCTYITDQNQFPEPTATSATLTLGRTCNHSDPHLLQRGAAMAPQPRG